MKRYQYLLLLSICFVSSAFASGFNLFSSTTLTCPSSFPSYAIWSDRAFPENYYAIYSEPHLTQPNVYTYSFIVVKADNVTNAKTKALTIATSGLTAYSNQPTPIPNWSAFYCAYHDSAYPFPNEPPPVQPSAEEAYVILWQTNGH